MPARTAVQNAALLVGAVFLVVGVLGFVPGVTTHHGAMEFAAHHFGAKLLFHRLNAWWTDIPKACTHKSRLALHPA